MYLCVFPDKGDAQTAAVVSQCGVGLLQREWGRPGGDPQTVQHQGEGPQHYPGLLARAALVLDQPGAMGKRTKCLKSS